MSQLCPVAKAWIKTRGRQTPTKESPPIIKTDWPNCNGTAARLQAHPLADFKPWRLLHAVHLEELL